MGARLLKVQFDRQVGTDGRQVAAQIGQVAPLFQFGPPAIFHLVEMGIDAVERAELVEQVEGGLFAHARHAGDVVGCVADEGFVIHHLLRADAELAGLYVFGRDVGLVIARHVDGGAFVDELQQVAVAGDDLDSQSLRGREFCHRAEHIVGLVAFHFEARDIERIHHLPNALNLYAQVVGHLFARGFVFGVEFVAEGLAGIERDRQVFGLFLLEDADEFAGKAVCSRGGLAFGSLPALTAAPSGREGKVHAVGQCMAVNKIKGWGHGLVL